MWKIMKMGKDTQIFLRLQRRMINKTQIRKKGIKINIGF